MSPSVLRVQAALDRLAPGCAVVELEGGARTAQQAADLLGVAVAQIAKSLVFRAVDSGRPVLVIASGDHRVSEAKVSALLGEPIERATPDFVREHSGFAIGGVAPVAHARPMTTFIDETIARFDRVWAAAGAPHTVFGIAPRTLFAIVDATVGDVAA